jgi:hypothetical protein
VVRLPDADGFQVITDGQFPDRFSLRTRGVVARITPECYPVSKQVPVDRV